MAAPIWATEIVNQVCLENNRRIPQIIWRQSRSKPYTTGSTNYTRSRIVITLGTRGHDHLQVLLHELAHYLNRGNGGGHTKEFYCTLKELLIKYDCLTEEYKQREYGYRRLSLLYL